MKPYELPPITPSDIKLAESYYLPNQVVDEDKLAEYVCDKTESAAQFGIGVHLPVVTVRLLLHCYMLARHHAKAKANK